MLYIIAICYFYDQKKKKTKLVFENNSPSCGPLWIISNCLVKFIFRVFFSKYWMRNRWQKKNTIIIWQKEDVDIRRKSFLDESITN